MCKKPIYLTLIVLAAVLVGSSSADVLVHWTFDEGSGTIVSDVSGNGRDGTFVGNPQWVQGEFGGALEFDGSSDYVIYNMPAAQNFDNFTVALWAKASTLGQGQWMAPFSSHTPNSSGIQIDVDGTSPGNYRTNPPGGTTAAQFGPVTLGWVHLALVGRGTTVEYYYNGSLSTTETFTANQLLFNEFLVGNSRNNSNYFAGAVDDFRVLDEALSADDIQTMMLSQGVAGIPSARRPSPADGALYEQTWANLTWTPGDWAVSHDLYFGTAFADVNDGAEGTLVGNLATAMQVVGFPGFPAPQGLVPGTTYYWRIDEVNDANVASPWKGNVWRFTVPPMTAYNADPPDGTKFTDPDLTLSWSGGLSVKLHNVFFGDNFDDVSSAAGALPQADAFFNPGVLAFDKTYYWRVDEFDGAATHKGDVWAFTTMPVIPVSNDPDLVAWWTFDEGSGTRALDWSGHGNHGEIVNQGWSDPGRHGDASLNAAGRGYVAIEDLSYATTGLTEITVCAWVRTSTETEQYIVSFDRNEYYRLEIAGSGGGPGQVGWDLMTNSGQLDYGSVTRVDDGRWHHVTGVFDNGRATIYIDGVAEPSATSGTTFGSGNTRFGFIGANSEATAFNSPIPGGSPVVGEVDDVRIYSAALTAEQIILIMRGDPLLAWNPTPADGTLPDVDNVTPLTWSPGDGASSHEVYFGTDRDVVKNADTSDTTGVYRGRQNGTSFTPAEALEWGAGPFYWRIDENNTDGTVTKGRLWSFTVADFVLVDDFESYTDNDAATEAIWQSWVDGFGIPTNGAQVGYLLPPYAEQTIVNGGSQSMPLGYNNRAGVSNSEAVLSLTAPRDWTRHGVGVLSLWFRGYPPSVGSFTEGPVGSHTITASGTDITGSADEFHYAYKTLTGPGTIVARIDSLENTNVWAKAGVMIRETLDADSAHAMAFVTPGQGVVFEYRLAAGQDNVGAAAQETGITAPHWVKLERDAAGYFTASRSINGSSWTPVQSSVPQNIAMASNVYIGLAVTSHNASATCEAKFSNVSITGTVGPQWTNQDIGIMANAAEPLYVALSNVNGTSAVVVNGDVNASVTDVWTEWLIDLSEFASQGVNLSNVDKIAIGLGSTGDANAAGGSGTMFIDDITLRKPAPQPQP